MWEAATQVRRQPSGTMDRRRYQACWLEQGTSFTTLERGWK